MMADLEWREGGREGGVGGGVSVLTGLGWRVWGWANGANIEGRSMAH